MTKEVERNLAKHFGCAILAPGDTIEIPLLDENQPEEVTIDEEIYSRLLIVYNHGPIVVISLDKS